MNPNWEPTSIPTYVYITWTIIGATVGSMFTWLFFEIKKDRLKSKR